MKNESIVDGHRESLLGATIKPPTWCFNIATSAAATLPDPDAVDVSVPAAASAATGPKFHHLEAGREVSGEGHAASAVCAGSTTGIREFEGTDAGRLAVAGQYPVLGRSAAYNFRVAGHEIGHCIAMRALSAVPISFVEITRHNGYEGRCCGADYEPSQHHLEDQTEETLAICSRIEKLAPGIGSSRIENAEIYVRAQTICIELVAGSIAEQILFPDQPPLRCEHDRVEARAVAAIACASPRAVDALLAYAESEAENLIRENLGAVVALVEALVDSVDGRLTGEQVDSVIQSTMDREYHMNVEVERRARWRTTEQNAASFVAEKME